MSVQNLQSIVQIQKCLVLVVHTVVCLREMARIPKSFHHGRPQKNGAEWRITLFGNHSTHRQWWCCFCLVSLVGCYFVSFVDCCILLVVAFDACGLHGRIYWSLCLWNVILDARHARHGRSTRTWKIKLNTVLVGNAAILVHSNPSNSFVVDCHVVIVLYHFVLGILVLKVGLVNPQRDPREICSSITHWWNVM